MEEPSQFGFVGPAWAEELSARVDGLVVGSSRRREFCHFTDIPSPSLLKRLLKGERGAAERQSRRRLVGSGVRTPR